MGRVIDVFGPDFRLADSDEFPLNENSTKLNFLQGNSPEGIWWARKSGPKVVFTTVSVLRACFFEKLIELIFSKIIHRCMISGSKKITQNFSKKIRTNTGLKTRLLNFLRKFKFSYIWTHFVSPIEKFSRKIFTVYDFFRSKLRKVNSRNFGPRQSL